MRYLYKYWTDVFQMPHHRQYVKRYVAFTKTTFMTKAFLPLIFVLTFFLTGCNKRTSENPENLNSTHFDTSIIDILPLDTRYYWVFDSGKPVGLSDKEITQIQSILIKCIQDNNPQLEKRFEEIKANNPEDKIDKEDYIINLTRYKRQYMARMNSKGEKEVWVNCFCNNGYSHSNKEPVIVSDGGNCYFNLKINLKTGRYFDFGINGEA